MEIQRQGPLNAASRFAQRASRVPRRNHVLVSSAQRLPQGAAGVPNPMAGQ